MNILFSLELLDRLEAPGVPEGYGISVAYSCLLDVINSIGSIINYQKVPDTLANEPASPGPGENEALPQKTSTEQNPEKPCDIDVELSEQVVNSTWCGLLAAFTLLIEAR